MPNNFNYHNPNRRHYSNYYRRSVPNVPKPNVNPNLELPSDIPPSSTTTPLTDALPPPPPPPKDSPLNSLLSGFKGLKLDTDTLILLGLIYLLYKEDTSREHFKVILALGYILL